MSDMIDTFRDLKAMRKAERKVFGVPCPKCAIARPKAHATILLPGQRCKVDGHRDTRASVPEDALIAGINAELAKEASQ